MKEGVPIYRQEPGLQIQTHQSKPPIEGKRNPKEWTMSGSPRKMLWCQACFKVPPERCLGASRFPQDALMVSAKGCWCFKVPPVPPERCLDGVFSAKGCFCSPVRAGQVHAGRVPAVSERELSLHPPGRAAALG